MKVYHGDQLVEEWDDSTKTYKRYNASGGVVEERPYTPEELADAEDRIENQQYIDALTALEDDIKAAIVDIIATRNMGVADIETAKTLETYARTIATQLQTQATQIGAWSPSTTYSRADMTAIRDQIKALAERQHLIATALADLYNYRQANNQASVKIYDAVLWIARRISGKLLD